MEQINALKKGMYSEVIAKWKGEAYAYEHTFSQAMPVAKAEEVADYIFKMLSLGDASATWISSYSSSEFFTVAFVFAEVAPLTINIPLVK